MTGSLNIFLIDKSLKKTRLTTLKDKKRLKKCHDYLHLLEETNHGGRHAQFHQKTEPVGKNKQVANHFIKLKTQIMKENALTYIL